MKISNIEYKDYKQLIYREAYKSAAGRPDVDVEDLASVGRLAFCKAKETYDCSVKFHTWLTRIVRQDLAVYYRSEQKAQYRMTTTCLWNQNHFGDVLHDIQFSEMLESLSEEAQEIVELLISGPSDLIEVWSTQSPTKIRMAVKRRLQEAGWSLRKIRRCFYEITRGLVRIS